MLKFALAEEVLYVGIFIAVFRVLPGAFSGIGSIADNIADVGRERSKRKCRRAGCKMRVVQIRPQHGGFRCFFIDCRRRKIIVRIVKRRGIVLTIGILVPSGAGGILSEEVERLELQGTHNGFVQRGRCGFTLLRLRSRRQRGQQRKKL